MKIIQISIEARETTDFLLGNRDLLFDDRSSVKISKFLNLNYEFFFVV